MVSSFGAPLSSAHTHTHRTQQGPCPVLGPQLVFTHPHKAQQGPCPVLGPQLVFTHPHKAQQGPCPVLGPQLVFTHPHKAQQGPCPVLGPQLVFTHPHKAQQGPCLEALGLIAMTRLVSSLGPHFRSALVPLSLKQELYFMDSLIILIPRAEETVH